MIPCLTCGEITQVYDSRLTETGVKRRRRCSNGHKFVTLEVLANSKQGANTLPAEFIGLWNDMLQDLHGQVTRMLQAAVRK